MFVCQELKFTERDMRRMRKEMALMIQGALIAREKEWCSKEQDWQRAAKQKDKEWLQKKQALEKTRQQTVEENKTLE